MRLRDGRVLVAMAAGLLSVTPLMVSAGAAPPGKPMVTRWSATDVPVSDVRTLHPGAQQNLYETSVAIDPTDSRVMLAFAIDLSAQNANPNLYSTNRAYRSTDGGRSWKDHGPLRYSARQRGPWEGGDPVAVFDGRGRAFLATLATPPGGGGGIYVHRSDDRGATWQLPTLAVGETCDQRTNTAISTDKEWISTDPRTGRLYLSYTGISVSCTSTGVPERTLDALLRISDVGIYLTSSDDQGRTWAPSRKVHDGYALGSIPKVGPDGTLYMAFWSSSQGPATCPGAVGLVLASAGGGPATAITTGRSTDGGRTWTWHSEPVCGFEVGESTKPGRFVGGSFLPSLSVDARSGVTTVAYPSFLATENRFGVFVTHTRGDRKTWSAPARVPTGSGDSRMPTVHSYGGALRLVYMDTAGVRDQDNSTPDGELHVRYVESLNEGRSWSRPVTLASRPGAPNEMSELGDYLGLDVTRDRIAAVWTDVRANGRGALWSRTGNLSRQHPSR